MTSTKQYKNKYWIEQNPKYAEDAAGNYLANVSLVDSGNMMALDRLYYNSMFAKSLE